MLIGSKWHEFPNNLNAAQTISKTVPNIPKLPHLSAAPISRHWSGHVFGNIVKG